jgi:hypothetical protein
LLFATANAFDFLLTAVMTLHCFHPASNVKTFGIAFLFILPGLTILAPIWGALACMTGSPTMMVQYSNINATLVALTYPL